VSKEIPNIYKKRQILLEANITSAESFEHLLKNPGWRNLLMLPLQEFELMMHSLKYFAPEIRSEVLAKLTNLEFQEKLRRARGKPVPARDIIDAIAMVKRYAEHFKLEPAYAQKIAADCMWDFLFMCNRDAKISVIGKLLGNKVAFLREIGFREDDILAIASTKRGAEWLKQLDLRELKEIYLVLKRNKLEPKLVLPILLKADLFPTSKTEKRPRNSKELEAQIFYRIHLGKRYGLSTKDIIRILTKRPELLVYGPRAFEHLIARHKKSEGLKVREKIRRGIRRIKI